MHDRILLNKISEGVKQLCNSNNIKKVSRLAVVVGLNSHVDENNLYRYLQYTNKDLIGIWTEIQVQKEDIQDQTAILHSIEGEKGEK